MAETDVVNPTGIAQLDLKSRFCDLPPVPAETVDLLDCCTTTSSVLGSFEHEGSETRSLACARASSSHGACALCLCLCSCDSQPTDIPSLVPVLVLRPALVGARTTLPLRNFWIENNTVIPIPNLIPPSHMCSKSTTVLPGITSNCRIGPAEELNEYCLGRCRSFVQSPKPIATAFNVGEPPQRSLVVQ